MDSEQLLFLLYTSGTTGKPKGIMHTSGGYLTQVAFTHKFVFDLHPDTDVFWCTADVGWVTGHSYIVYGPLANGATSVMYEGVPNFPGNDRLWSIIEKYKVTKFYTAPTAIRTFMKWGAAEPASTTCRSCACSGRSENDQPGMDVVPREHRRRHMPVVDTWWQTETGGIMISPLRARRRPNRVATFPLPVSARRWSTMRAAVSSKAAGTALTRPWPGMRVGSGDPTVFDTLLESYEGRYFAGEAATRRRGLPVATGSRRRRDERQRHRISPPSRVALVSHPAVAEAAVVGALDDTTGQAIKPTSHCAPAAMRHHELRNHSPPRSARSQPKTIYFTNDIPKTRSGKIMRRLLLSRRRSQPRRHHDACGCLDRRRTPTPRGEAAGEDYKSVTRLSGVCRWTSPGLGV